MITSSTPLPLDCHQSALFLAISVNVKAILFGTVVTLGLKVC